MTLNTTIYDVTHVVLTLAEVKNVVRNLSNSYIKNACIEKEGRA